MIINRIPENEHIAQEPEYNQTISATPDSRKKIKSMNRELRPREKAIANGCGALTLPELWALILGSGTKGINVIDMCTELMERNDFNLTILARRSLKQISAVKGLGQSKALQIAATLEIARRYQQQQLPDRPGISSSQDVNRLMRPEIAHLGHEEMWILMLNRANKVIRLYQASRGTTTATLFDLKGIIKEALLEQAEGLIMVHNHPSGNCKPSGQDDSITIRCREACRTLDLRLLDHLIITANDYYSYRDEGKL